MERKILDEIVKIAREYENLGWIAQGRRGADFMDRILALLRSYGYLEPNPMRRDVVIEEDDGYPD